MSAVVFTSRTDAQRYERLCAKAFSLPSKGRHVGGGRHVPMTDDPSSPGWTIAWDTVREHPTRTEFAVIALEPSVSNGRVNEQEKTELETRYASRETLDASWDEEGAR